MIGDVLSILEKLLKIKKSFGDDQKEAFNTHVQQIFDEMIAIHKDYREQSRQAIIRASRDEIDRDFAEKVWENKIDLEPVRMKIFALASLAKEDRGLPIKVREFLLACAKYLNVFFHERDDRRSVKEFEATRDPDEIEECYSAMYSGMMECLERYLDDGDKEALTSRLRNIDSLLVERWSILSVAYADAKLEHL